MRKIFCLIIFLCLNAMSWATHTKDNNAYRDFWYPTYRIQALNYCALDRHCGKTVAQRYCRLMGYERVAAFEINHNVGKTKYIDSNIQCLGCRCDGFTWIRCAKSPKHCPIKQYYYRYRRFVYPRYQRCRVDWCYTENRECGLKAANSFCRRMGYLKATQYQIDHQAYKTKTLGNHVLCFGDRCRAFRSITCFR